MAIVEFTYEKWTDPDTGLPVNVRKPDTNEKIVAWGAALNELAKQTVFSDGTYQPTKLEILNAHPYFIVGKNPNYASPQIDYASNENVQLRAVSFKVVPGTFTIALTTTQLGLATTVTTAKAQVFFDISESASVGTIEIVNPSNANGFPMVYGEGGLKMWTITIPTDIVLATIGDSISGTLQIGIIEHYKIASTQYNVGSCSADNYNQLIEGSNVFISDLKPIEPKTTE